MRKEEVVLQILGMHCPACAQRIENTLSKLEGIIEAKVNFALKEVIVRFNLDRINIEKIKATIKRTGYEAVEQEEGFAEKRKKVIKRKLMLFFIGLALTIPIVVITYFLSFPEKNIILLVLTTPVQFIVGWHFYKGAYNSLRNRFADMNVIVAFCASASYF